MIEHKSPQDTRISYRKEMLGKPIGLGKNAIHLICVILVMQLLQLTQGLVTEADLSNYNVLRNIENNNVTTIAPSTRALLLDGGSSIMAAVHNGALNSHYKLKDMVSPTAVMATTEGFQIVDSLMVPQIACAPFISCDFIESGGSSCCDNLAETQIKKNKVLPVTRSNVSSTTARGFFTITTTPVLKIRDIKRKKFADSKEFQTTLKQKMLQVDPYTNLIQTPDEKCDSHEVFLGPSSNYSQIRLRIKREADGNKRSPISARNRFRRPTSTTTTTEEETSEEVTQPAILRRNQKSGGLHSTASKPTVASKKRLIKPSRVSTVASNRAKFTLREETTTAKSSTSSRRAPFRRPQISSGIGNKRVTNSKINSSVGGNRRINTHEESHTRSTLGTRGRTGTTGTTGRSRAGTFKESDSRSRHRGSQDFNNEPPLDLNDGTITVTHLTPSETQIPVVNGQHTEYKQIVVAKTSTEVLGPQQYTTSFAANGQSVLVLTSQGTSVNHAGATEITQYILHETPTTSVTFTPTTIRGRRTSFSYVLPSTAYSVENIVSTVQPQISADAPLANILLSQLLLGNAGFPNNQLFGAGDNNANFNANVNAVGQAAPTTEYKTHTSTYVTTVFEGTSTILPITFQGKKIITTIYDTTPKVITATEFVTDTIVLPGVASPQAQGQSPINNLLLQQLLLQQVAQKQEQNPVPHITPTTQQAFAFENTKLPDYETDSGHNALLPSGNSFSHDDIPEVTTSKPRRNGKKHKKRNKEETKSGETSIVTLYVSGKFPGEFSTVLSTVHVRPDATVHKRHATDFYSVNHLDDDESRDDFELPRSLGSESVIVSKQEATQSLTDILGDRHKWHVDQKPTLAY